MMATVASFCLWLTSYSLAADDLDVFLPRELSVAGSSNPAIYWRYQPGASGYLIDLIGPNTSSITCDGLPRDPVYVAADAADCGTRRVTDINYGDSMPPETPLCVWYPGDLPSGHYALSVNAWSFNDGWVGSDTLTRVDCTPFYQKFQVETPSLPPQQPMLQTPVNGLDCEIYTLSLVSSNTNGCFPTISEVDATASWVQLWVNDAHNFNLLNRWYPINELECVVELGIKRCSFDDISVFPYFGGASPYKWWVRTWNPAGSSSWTTSGLFTVSPP